MKAITNDAPPARVFADWFDLELNGSSDGYVGRLCLDLADDPDPSR
jgi:hypothetical protein